MAAAAKELKLELHELIVVTPGELAVAIRKATSHPPCCCGRIRWSS